MLRRTSFYKSKLGHCKGYQLNEFAQNMKVKVYKEGEVIFDEGDTKSSCAFILTGKVSKRRFDMTDLSNAQIRSIDKGIAGDGQKVSTLCGPQQSLRDVMLEGNGNPITGALPKQYEKFSFRDVELAAKAGAAKQDMADRHARDLGHQFTLHHR